MSEILKPYQQDFAKNIYSSGAFQIKPEGDGFTLKIHQANPEAPKSPYYINLRKDAVGDEAFERLVQSLAMAIQVDCLDIHYSDSPIRPDRVVGIPKAGTPIAKAYQEITGLPMLVMDKEESDSRRKISSVIHGDFKPGMKILGVDDLITGADTKFEFKEGVEANELVLAHMAVGLDREQGGIGKLREAGVSVSAALTVTQLLDYGRSSNRLSETDYDRLRTYIDSQS